MSYISYLIYLALNVPIILFVGQQCYHHGRHFLHRSFPTNEELADTINSILLAGYYLLNIGWIILTIWVWSPTPSLENTIEQIIHFTSINLLIIGSIHYFNLYGIYRLSAWVESKNNRYGHYN